MEIKNTTNCTNVFDFFNLDLTSQAKRNILITYYYDKFNEFMQYLEEHEYLDNDSISNLMHNEWESVFNELDIPLDEDKDLKLYIQNMENKGVF